MAEFDASHAGQTIKNATASLIPSPGDLFLAIPRLASRAKSWLISEASSNKTTMLGAPAGLFSQSGEASQAASSAASDVGGFFDFLSGPVFQRISNVDGIFSYILSRWAVSTFFIAILLNRSHVYSSSRRHLTLNWKSRLMLRVLPIIGFLYQIFTLLQAMRCQTGAYPLPTLVTGLEKRSFASLNQNGFVYWLSSTLLFWQDDTQACIRSGMTPAVESDKLNFSGSSTLLWPLFMTLCLSHLIETVSCSLEGRSPMAETGMTIFEHSLAFAEAEAVVRSSAGMGFFGWSKSHGSATSSTKPSASSTAAAGDASRFMVTPAMLLSRLNVPPEVLLIGFISSCSHLSSHVLAVTGLQSRFRLVNTGIWGTCFMSAFLWSFIKFSRPATIEDVGVLRYPTVCIIGFIPHLLIVVGIILCAFIYGIALLATVLSPPPSGKARESLAERFSWALSNMQANVSLANIKISWHEEFYTTLLKVGFTMMTAASEAVYFNEGTDVGVAPMTWLEEKRLGEVSRARKLAKQLKSAIPAEIQGDSTVADGIGLVEEDQLLEAGGQPVNSGYARERKTTEHSSLAGAAAVKEEGVGGSQRSGRWLLSLHLMREVFSLAGCAFARCTLYLLRQVGILNAPPWLVQIARHDHSKPTTPPPKPKQKEFWDLDDQARVVVPKGHDFDVEATLRRRSIFRSEQDLDEHLYGWWAKDGQWGERDASGDYEPSRPDDDLTSMISESDAASNASGWQTDSDSEAAGSRTPTRANPRGLSPDADPPLAHLATLLNPRTFQEKEEARLLSRRLQTPGPMTRAAYRRGQQSATLHLLSPHAHARVLAEQPLSGEEEEQMLERVILSRRAERYATHRAEGSAASWATGAEGMGDAGPQCVVCHSAPRTILVWPCRCLSLCEECRVSLAMNNFNSCVCCRRDVAAFSRLFVP